MPGHFILKHALAEPALFIDPFGGGRVLSEADCLRYLEEGEFGYDPTYLLPMSDGAILLRMVRNLLLIYRNRGDTSRHELLHRLKRVLVGPDVPDPELNKNA